MRKALQIVARHSLLFAGLLLAACGSGKNAAVVTVVAIGEPAAPFEKGLHLSPPARLVRGATVEGLVGFDEQAQIVPALADRWIVTDDGLSYIFRLRDGTWADGTPLTAESVRATLRETIARLHGTPLALDLGAIEEIRAMAGRVIEIRLVAPMPDLLQLLAQPELGLARHGQGTGPMRLKRDRDGALLTAIPPEQRGLPAVEGWNRQQRLLHFLVLPAEAAVDRFNSGEADILLGGRIEDFPLARSVGLLRATIQLDPVMGLFGLAVTREASAPRSFLAAPENREALAMAIDRDGLLEPFGVGGWTATSRIVPPGVADDPRTVGERWAGLRLDERRSQASARVARWRQAQPGAPPVRLRIALPRGQGGDMLFGQLAANFQAIGIAAQRVGPDDAADLRLVDVVARYPRAAWFLDQLSCAAAHGLCAEDADDLAAQAQRAGDPAVRANLLTDAEVTLTRANVFIPLGAPIRWSLVRGDASGFAVNRWNIHPLMPMALRPK
jgi:peptide/nickel transport system substrate-binding protein/oligopeptide transport system substrate-binding protein